jgi:disulfide oxidoreductase YuzD
MSEPKPLEILNWLVPDTPSQVLMVRLQRSYLNKRGKINDFEPMITKPYALETEGWTVINTTLANIVKRDYSEAYEGKYEVNLTLFNLAPEGWSSGTKENTPSRKNVIQSIVNQPTEKEISEWVSNNRYTRKSKQGMLPLWIYIDVNDAQKKVYVRIIPRLKNRQYEIGSVVSVSSEIPEDLWMMVPLRDNKPNYLLEINPQKVG